MLSSGPPKILQFIPSRRPAVMARMRNGPSAPHALGVLHPFVLRPWRSAWSQAERSGFRDCWSLWRQKASCPLPDEASAGVASQGASPVISKRLAGIPIHVLLRRPAVWQGWRPGPGATRPASCRRCESCADPVGLPLIALGPTVGLITPGLRALGERLDRRGARLCQRWGVHYCSLPAVADAEGMPYYSEDRVHLTAAGHGYVARQLRVDVGMVWL